MSVFFIQAKSLPQIHVGFLSHSCSGRILEKKVEGLKLPRSSEKNDQSRLSSLSACDLAALVSLSNLGRVRFLNFGATLNF